MSQQQLLLLLIGLPPTPSSLRVRVWRRLRSLGAVPLKRSAYLFPDTPDRYEDFQWLAQEVQREGGDATLVRVQQIENMKDADILRLFHEPRDHDYRQLAARYRKVLQALEKKSAASGARVHDEVVRLAKDHQRLRDIDFYDAPGGMVTEVQRSADGLRARIVAPGPNDLYAPSVDRLFGSASDTCGERMIAVIMTGMGDDGAEAIRKVRQRGGKTIAESPDTAIIFGMPNQAIKTGAVDQVLPLNEIAGAIERLCYPRVSRDERRIES